jgi:uncharacterized protein with ParB-like and HNH nuclease domain
MGVGLSTQTVGDLLTGRTLYAVPIFQRSYSWEKKQVSDFWTDLCSMYSNTDPDKSYFIGSMVFTPHQEQNK